MGCVAIAIPGLQSGGSDPAEHRTPYGSWIASHTLARTRHSLEAVRWGSRRSSRRSIFLAQRAQKRNVGELVRPHLYQSTPWLRIRRPCRDQLGLGGDKMQRRIVAFHDHVAFATTCDECTVVTIGVARRRPRAHENSLLEICEPAPLPCVRRAASPRRSRRRRNRVSACPQIRPAHLGHEPLRGRRGLESTPLRPASRDRCADKESLS